MIAELGLDIVLLLAVVAFCAGFVDSIAGGGGLITVPALMLAGYSPVEALGTNKLQGLFGTASATWAYASKGHVDVKRQWPAALLSFGGGVLGSAAATVLPSDWLSLALPFLLVAIGLYFAFKPDMGDVDRAERITPFVFGLTVVPLIGFYDGVFGPGTGSFFMLSFVALAGYGMLKATAHTKLLNLASNIGGFVGFALAGAVVWQIGLVMGICQIAGARAGATLAMKKGAGLIRPLLVVTSTALVVRLLWEPDHPLRLLIGW